MKDDNSDNRGEQNGDNKELDYMMSFEEVSGTTGKQDDEASYSNGNVYIVISPLTLHRDLVDEENIV